MGTQQNTEYKLKYINQSIKSFKQQAQYKSSWDYTNIETINK